MKSFRQLVQELSEASLWPGTPEYKKKYGASMPDDKDGSRHKIEKSAGVVRATRKYDADSGESEEPTKNRDDVAAAPVKRGRGRPPGKYGTYKKKVKESLEILESLETEEEIQEFIDSLDEESFGELEAHLSEEAEEADLEDFTPEQIEEFMQTEEFEQLDELSKTTLGNYIKKRQHDVAAQGAITRRHAMDSEKARQDQNYTQQRKSSAMSDKAFVKGWKYRQNISKAVDRLTKEETEVTEELKGNQHKIDANKNGKLDAHDFKLLRAKKKNEEVEVKEEQIDESVSRYANFITKNK